MDWKEEYSMGILEIDNHHKSLLKQFTAIEDAISQRASWSETHYLIVALIEFAKFHFEFEEALMRLFGAPSFEKHHKEHKKFFVMLNELEQRSLKQVSEAEWVNFLRDWLTHHILGSDREYAAWILGGASVVGCKRD